MCESVMQEETNDVICVCVCMCVCVCVYTHLVQSVTDARMRCLFPMFNMAILSG